MSAGWSPNGRKEKLAGNDDRQVKWNKSGRNYTNFTYLNCPEIDTNISGFLQMKCITSTAGTTYDKYVPR